MVKEICDWCDNDGLNCHKCGNKIKNEVASMQYKGCNVTVYRHAWDETLFQAKIVIDSFQVTFNRLESLEKSLLKAIESINLWGTEQ